ncbi:hypothetical protein [Haloarcula pellucida]|uniref:Uncharacterized protein n=1 Tax=Haloarcula pellucida TaxID=1427151 RepID=A0A830GPZ3_9EURY|nr:hypothetical protein [Halomicroarcula pellucida]MBX0349435.1 hypothetical protein [Halomicroarcula pellucida]GGO02932.1 hypothetical protein GCM10009030_38070 [Halomicroarcula pellucida]
MWRPVLVVAVVALAGCSGLFASADTSSSERPLTPAPVPETTTGTVALPRENGSVDLDRILDRHEAALADRSFHRHVEREGPQNTRDVWVDRERGITRVRRTFGPLTDDAVVANGTLYRSVRDDPDTDYVTEPSDGQIPYVSSASGAARLRLILDAEEYHRLGTVQRDGRALAVVGSNDTAVPVPGADPDQTVAVRSRIYVDRAGVVRYVDYRERRTVGAAVVIRMRVTTGIDRISVPWWADELGLYG